ncbi:CPBP family intramembrane glutamic endopeptidase [Lewinella sp. 4G2]|uniref:CPBP family intramembrane glutamic endopeptidase n=1 Tax=Lewinella sp. 4G2 TaxID=1803372 RepID=UPI0007B4BC2E|nr:CPBP family intramembrane glutamic endopeptidase [Lewinella sp. 4G2]OAV45574.1 hypothetical protein A3850_014210 [Lewinella sp. 4G2]
MAAPFHGSFASPTPIQLHLHILFVLLGIVFPAILFVTSYRRAKSSKRIHWTQRMKTHLYYSNGGLLFTMAALVLAGWWFAGRPLTEIGLGWGKQPYDLTAVIVLSAFVGLYLLDVLLEAGSAERREETRKGFRKLGFLPSSATQFLNFIFLAFAAGIGEEIVYRGFMITYLLELFGDGTGAVAGAMLIPAVAFGLGHFYQGWKAVLKIVVMAILFGFFYLRTETLWPLILLHTAIDIFGGLMAWYLLGRR